MLVIGVSFSLLAGLWNPAFAQSGKTIFGDDKKMTVNAMKGIAKSLGVKCLFCHVKEGGKIKYDADSPHKILARKMKTAFVDSLVIKGEIEIAFEDEGHKTTLKAVYAAAGKAPGIHLTAVNKTGKTFEKTLPLPEKDAAGKTVLNCMTCHGGKTHFLTEDHGEGLDEPVEE